MPGLATSGQVWPPSAADVVQMMDRIVNQPSAADIVQVMDRIVNQVPGEAVDGEPGAVAARPGALPLRAGEPGKTIGDAVGGLGQLAGDDGGILVLVVVRDRGRVLVPVGEDGIVLVEHHHQPLVKDPEHVSYVAAVFGRRPAILPRPYAHVSGVPVTQRRLPGRSVLADQPRHRGPGDRGGDLAAFRAPPLQHPRPVLGIWCDRHQRAAPASAAACDRTASANAAISGCTQVGSEDSSGWNSEATQNGWSGSSATRTSPLVSRPLKTSPWFCSISR